MIMIISLKQSFLPSNLYNEISFLLLYSSSIYFIAVSFMIVIKKNKFIGEN